MFSIIMPVYNSLSTLDIAINSILAQTRRDFELIIIDDGSIDGSYDRCIFYSMQDSRVRVYKNPHGGVSEARNRGIDEARGDIILFIDSDDSWEVDLLENAPESKDGVCALFGFKTNFYDKDGTMQRMNVDFPKVQSEIFTIKNDNIDALFNYNIASPWNKFYNANIIRNNHIKFNIDMVYLEDLEFNLQYLKYCTTLTILHKNLYNYNIISDQVQILKRNFNSIYRNADILYETATQYCVNMECTWKGTKLSGIILGAYCREALSWMYKKDYTTAMSYLKQLNNNEKFLKILDCSSGKFIKLLRFVVRHNLLFIQKRMLKKRYW